MPISYPKTKRYPFHYRHEDTGLTPVFTLLKRLDTLVTLGTLPGAPVDLGGNPVTVVEIGNGWYYFDWIFQSAVDPDVIFEIDGGASIPTEEIRYLSDGLSVSNLFLDESVSQVVVDVWADNASQGAGTKGFEVNQIPAVKARTDDIPVDLNTQLGSIETMLLRAVGMLHENSVLDLTTFDTNNNLTAGRLRLYSTSTDATAAKAASPGVYDTNKIAQYSISATYTGSNLQTYLVTKI